MEPIGSGASAVADEPEGTTGFSDPVSVSGEARDLDGALLREVSVRMIKSGGEVDPRRVATASDGTFVIDDIRPGNWRLEVRGIVLNRLPGGAPDLSCGTNAREIEELTGVRIIARLGPAADFDEAARAFDDEALGRLFCTGPITEAGA